MRETGRRFAGWRARVHEWGWDLGYKWRHWLKLGARWIPRNVGGKAGNVGSDVSGWVDVGYDGTSLLMFPQQSH